jgi:2'-5' RNA ligase
MDAAPLYALVAYVRDPVGLFVESLRREVHPGHPEWPAHVTVVPPRHLLGPEGETVCRIDEVCRAVAPFEVLMGGVETFAPTTPTVFIRVAHAGYRLRELHDKLAQGTLACEEPWPYMPHMTIAKLPDEQAARRAADIARERWDQFRGPRRVHIEELTFVRQGELNQSWVDLSSVRLQGEPVRR